MSRTKDATTPPRFDAEHAPEKGDSPLTLGEAAKADFRHPRMSEQQIEKHRQYGPAQFTFPAYNVGRGYLLLDGAHRSIATLRAGVEYNIELAAINRPIDQRVLVDLAVFE